MHPIAGDVWTGNKRRLVLQVTELWIYYRIEGKEYTLRCRKSTWKTWRERYKAVRLDADTGLGFAMAFFAELSASQKPLPPDFAKILYENLWDLYES